MKRFKTVRSGYLYIFGGTALLSGISLAAVYSLAALLYSRYTAASAVYWVRSLRWLINHIGRIPLAVLMFTAVFTVIFLLRSQKISDDLKSLLQASEELSTFGSFRELKVVSGGELGQLAGHLHKINRPEKAADQGPCAYNLKNSADPVLGNEALMALTLRTRTLMRLLNEASTGKGEQIQILQVEAAKREAMGMERFMENLMVRS
ncbi:hypothetical protein A3842_29080 [Paenibacillus sp. P3E]|uniref:hypothetical protein n=1 Tax=Paenibacillus sp. P3E TaxID=1349435 RepID=UPI0009400006|nr:hypothetical protein [Paenibacillus sp. P3E]OKP66681.1 hypothetical protein A3842_29080 [Paenibacillus sp. P3E]